MDTIAIPFPNDLYKLIVVRSGGRLDPTTLAINLIEAFVERNSEDDAIWTDEGLKAFAEEKRRSVPQDVGDPTRGHQWGPVFMPNGTELRMDYKRKSYYARVEFDRVVDDGTPYPSVSQWVRRIARNTSRNAWLDVWIRVPGEREFRSANILRRERRGH